MLSPYGYICGCYYLKALNQWSVAQKTYIAQVSTKAHTTILASTSRTTLTQTFVNPSESKAIKELNYSFPLYDGVSVVGFTCRIGNRTIIGEVKEKDKARAVFKEAKERGEVAGLLEQVPEASDVFITKLGNIPPDATIVVEITYLGELKHDAEVDGLRLTIPTFIAPRYGQYPSGEVMGWQRASVPKGFQVTVDAELGDGAYIREMRSPSHPIAVSLGTTSFAQDADPQPNKASATLSLGTAELDKDFVLQVVAKELAVPKAMLETHPTIPGQRALMATLVPKFALPPEHPEIVFLCDRSGSMQGNRITALRNALQVFLKSLPIGTKFNICSFGSRYDFLWEKSQSYSQSSLDQATKHVESFSANYGGTSMYGPIDETIQRRYKDMNLEIFLVTDGETWDQQSLFNLVNRQVGEKKAPIRIFTLGVGDGASTALIEGIARAGNGFSQAVGDNEKLDGKVIRMLKAALSPHVEDYTLDVTYADGSVDKALEDVSITLGSTPAPKAFTEKISLFDTSANLDATEAADKDDDGQSRYKHLPAIEPPLLIQAPHKIPPLYAFSRTTVYLLLSPMTRQSTPTKVTLRATSKHGPLELDIPVQVLPEAGETIHQLAAKRAVHELEEGRGWLNSAKDAVSGKLLRESNEGRFSEFVECEAVRLGVQFQVGGKFCSFVAVEKKDKEGDRQMTDADDWEYLDEDIENLTLLETDRYVGSNKSKRKSTGRGRDRDRSVPQENMADGNDSMRRRSGGPPRFSRGGAAPRMQMMSQAAKPSPPSAARSAATPFGSMSSFGGATSATTAMAPQRGGTRNREKSGLFSGLMARKSSGYNDASIAGADDWDDDLDAVVVPAAASFSASAANTNSGNAIFADSKSEMEPASASALASHQQQLMLLEQQNKKRLLMARQDQAAPPPPPAPSSGPGFSLSFNLAIGKAAVDAQNRLQALISLQTFEGYWVVSEGLCRAVGVTPEAARRKGIEDNVLGTVLAVHFLTTKLKNEKDSWELLVDKAMRWLHMNGCGDGSHAWDVAADLINGGGN